MSSFLQSVRSAYKNKETIIKDSITTQLSECVKEIQLCTMNENLSGDSLNINDASNTLSSIIEAVFLHGLKDSLAYRARRVISNDVDQRPEPSFWSALLIFSHRQIIDQITALTNITTEIGQCRAWIRIALNDSLLSSYLVTIRQNSRALKLFYKSHAYIRDIELLEVAQKLIEGIETCAVFSLPYNSTLLNNWSPPTLILAGVWFPTLRQCPIVSGVDVAQSLENSCSSTTNSNICSADSMLSFAPHSSEMRKMLAMNEDDALKIILSNTSAISLKTNNTDTASASSEEVSKPKEKEQTEEECSDQLSSSVGNSLDKKSGWSSDDAVNVKQDSVAISDTSIEIKSTENSYHALIESYNLISSSFNKTPNLQEVWQNFENKSSNSSVETEETETTNDISKKQFTDDDDDDDESFDFQFVAASELDKHNLKRFCLQLGKLAQEKGLDSQNFECFDCKHPLSINISKPRMCSFTGDCFCDSCISPDPVIIPARVIYNWDFKLYFVSKKAAIFLTEVKNHPLLDMKVLNSYIYTGVEDMNKIQTLRIQLNFLRDYLYTCREPVIEQLKHLLWPKEYLYEHVHQYSIADLSLIPNGVLAETLQNVVKFGKDHVTKCWLCNQKGFVCEICNKPKILYPFNVESTYRCKDCKAVYHSECLNASKPCPKCKRRREREHMSLLDATLEYI